MPQIWPMNWIVLFFLFMVVFLAITTLMYFNMSYSVPEDINDSKNIVKLNWKW